MKLSNKELLSKLNSAIKGIIDEDTLGDSLLVAQQFDRFVRSMQHETNILPEARYIEMQNHKVNIDRISFTGRVLEAGVDSDDNHKTLEENEFTEPNTGTNQLIARELQAVVGIYDKTLRRNIERDNFEDTIVELLGEAAGRDLEEWGLLARENYEKTEDLLLSLTDGWLTRASNKIFGQEDTNADRDFDLDADNYPVNMFNAMIQALPKRFLGNRTDWRFYVPFEVEDAYRDYLADRGTALGDQAIVGHEDLTYKRIPVVYSPMIERSKNTGDEGSGRVATLQNPDNMCWGVFHEVNIEPEREAKKRRTDFVLTFEGDADYEEEDAAVSAYLDLSEDDDGQY